MIEINTCPACGNTDFKLFITPIDFTVSGESFNLKKCSSCNLLVTTPQPDEQEIQKYYASPDYISHTDKPASLIDTIYKLARYFTLRSKVRLIKNLQPEITNILDYGCGTGDFLRTCQRQGWTVAGIEPSDNARKIAATKLGSQSVQKTFVSQNPAYQAITLWHVLEHVHNLSKLLAQLKANLANDGRLIIAVPNVNTWESIHYREHWAAYDVPRHLWHFNRNAMTTLFTKQKFTLTEIYPMKLDAYYVSLLSEKYKRGGTTISGMINALKNGSISNTKAKRTGEYSSLIYVFKHA